MATRIRVEKICQYCQKEFIAKTLKTRYCSKICNSRAYKDKLREEKLQEAKSGVVREKTTTLPHPVESNLKVIQGKEVLTVLEVSKLLGLSKPTVYRLIKEGKIKATKISARNTRIHRSEIDKLFHSK